jgi:25S rRNA (uracil2634-N3)-methyltransferase
MWYFFYNARCLVRQYGEVHVTHKTGGPYDKWDLEHLAAECSLVLVMKVGFQKEDYPGYNQKRGDGARCDEPFGLSNAYTFMFQIGDLKKLKKMNQNRAHSISNLGGNNVHTGQWATDAGPFHPLPPVEAWPPQPSQWATGRGQFHPLPPIEAWPLVHLPPPINTDHISLHPYIADERQQPGFPLNPDGRVGSPYFHEHDTFCPTPSMPGPAQNDLPALGGIPPAMGRITHPKLLPPPEQPWYQLRTISDPQECDGLSFLAQEYQRSLQREYDMRRRLMPGSTSSNYPAFLEHRYMESVKKQEWLCRMIALYGRQ